MKKNSCGICSMMAVLLVMATVVPSLAFMAQQHSVPQQSTRHISSTTRLFVGMPLDPTFNLTTIGIPTPYRNEQERKEYQAEMGKKSKKIIRSSSVAVAERDVSYTTTSHAHTSTGWSSGVVPEGVEEDDYVEKASGTFNFLMGLGAVNAALLVVLLGSAVFNPSPAVVVDNSATAATTSIEKTTPTTGSEDQVDDLNWITGSWEILNN